MVRLLTGAWDVHTGSERRGARRIKNDATAIGVKRLLDCHAFLIIGAPRTHLVRSTVSTCQERPAFWNSWARRFVRVHPRRAWHRTSPGPKVIAPLARQSAQAVSATLSDARAATRDCVPVRYFRSSRDGCTNVIRYKTRGDHIHHGHCARENDQPPYEQTLPHFCKPFAASIHLSSCSETITRILLRCPLLRAL